MLSHVRQGRRGVEEMLDQAASVLAGMGATRETLKVRTACVDVKAMVGMVVGLSCALPKLECCSRSCGVFNPCWLVSAWQMRRCRTVSMCEAGRTLRSSEVDQPNSA